MPRIMDIFFLKTTIFNEFAYNNYMGFVTGLFIGANLGLIVFALIRK